MGVRERALAPRRRTALGALLRVPLRGPRQRVAPNGSRNAGAAAACRGLGLRRELGRNAWTGRRLCLAHCGDLAFPGRERAPQLEKLRRPRTFLQFQGRTTPGRHYNPNARPQNRLTPHIHDKKEEEEQMTEEVKGEEKE